MNAMQLLLVTNGAEETRPALQAGVQMAQYFSGFVTLLGVQEPGDAHHPVAEAMSETMAALQQADIDYRVLRQTGYAEDVLVDVAARQLYDMVVVGSLGRPALRRWLLGRSIRHFLEFIPHPLLYVPQLPRAWRRMLVCLGGLGYALPAERFAVSLAEKTGGDLTLLHIVPPLSREYPVTEQLRHDWQHIDQSDTVIGRSLQRAEALAPQARCKIRHGEVVEEILAEIREGDYDLVCMGSPYGLNSLRTLLTPNVTAEIAEKSGRPVYAARSVRSD